MRGRRARRERLAKVAFDVFCVVVVLAALVASGLANVAYGMNSGMVFIVGCAELLTVVLIATFLWIVWRMGP